MKKQLIFPKSKYWREQEALCGILNEWHGKNAATRIIGELTSQPKPVQNFIEQILERDSSPEAIEFQRAKIAWAKIVPTEYEKTAFPYYIKRKILYVKVHDSWSLMELKMRERELSNKLFHELKEPNLKKISFIA